MKCIYLFAMLLLFSCSNSSKPVEVSRQDVSSQHFESSQNKTESTKDSIVLDSLLITIPLPEYLISYGKGKYAIVNQVGGRTILPTYKNDQGLGDTIYLSEINYAIKEDSTTFIVASMQGFSTSIVLATANTVTGSKILYAEQFRTIQSWQLSDVVHSALLFEAISYPYSIMCMEMTGYRIFRFDKKRGVNKVFEDLILMKYSEKSEECPDEVSYVQKFELSESPAGVILQVLRSDDRGVVTDRKFKLGKIKFDQIN